ncbi:MAG: sugar phosphate isomerase/epimerase [Clostridia bacterium]|nr:sugar phosphate isomerase/epimerase [Clostridia bacterium]
MLIGASTASAFEKLGIDGGFKMFRDAGMNCVDFGFDWYCNIWKFRRGDTEGNIFTRPQEEITEFFRPFKEAADKYGIKIHQAHAPFPSWIDTKIENSENTNAFALEAIKKCFPVLKMMDCRLLIVHPAFPGYDGRLEADDEWDLNIRFYSALIEDAKKYDVIVCLENMFVNKGRKIYAAICQDPMEAAAYVDELNDIAGETRFGFCYDTGHGLLIGQDVYSALKVLGDRVVALHVHDNDGMDDRHVAPYMGVLDWERFIKGLRAIDYKGAMTLEIGTMQWLYPGELMTDAYRLSMKVAEYFAKRVEAPEA